MRGRLWRLVGAGGAGRVGVRSVSGAGGGGSLGAVNHPLMTAGLCPRALKVLAGGGCLTQAPPAAFFAPFWVPPAVVA